MSRMKTCKKKNEHRAAIAGAVLVLTLGCLSGCARGGSDTGTSSAGSVLIDDDESYEKHTVGSYAVKDDKSLYGKEADEIVTYYVTVGRGSSSDNADHTWAEVNNTPLSSYDEDENPYLCEAALQVGDDYGPLEGEFGYDTKVANALIGLKGTGASEKQQKSYKLSIMEGKGKIDGQKTIILNKYMMDPFRFTDAMMQSIMAQDENVLGRRAKLVHLYVKDKTEGEDGKFVDYGLYTQLEAVNGTYLKKRSLDTGGSLYKTVDFDFGRHEDVIMETTNKGYDEKAFDEYLESKADAEDHSSLIEMLIAVNDDSWDTASLLDRYFDRDNLYSFMAYHILSGDQEGAKGGYYLYKPQVSDKWYFITGEADHAFRDLYANMKNPDYETPWDNGVFMFSGNKLFERILSDENCRVGLNTVVEDLYSSTMSQESVSNAVQQWTELAEETLFSLPDSRYLRVNQTQWDQLSAQMSSSVRTYIDEYYASLLSAWPFDLNDTAISGDQILISWEEAYLYGTGNVTYHVELSHDPGFGSCLADTTTESTSVSVPSDGKGEYFVRVTAITADGHEMPANGYYQTEKKVKINGVQLFYILDDGSLAVSHFDYDE